MPETMDLTDQLQRANTLFDQGEFQQALDVCDQVIENAPRGSELVAEADELRSHAVEHELLEAISAANDWQTAIPLIQQALDEKKLRYDLERYDLRARLEQWEARRGEDADQRVMAALEDGRDLRSQKDYAAAAQSCEQAASIEYASAGVRQQAETARKDNEKILQRQAEYHELLKLAVERQQAGEFDEALKAAAAAAIRFPESPEEAEDLLLVLETQVEKAGETLRLRGDAEEDAKTSHFARALENLATAIEVAQELNWATQIGELERLRQDIQEKQTQQQRAVQTRVKEAQAAIRGGRWADAERLIDEIAGLEPDNADLPDLRAQALQGEETRQRISRIRNEAAAFKNPFDRLTKYREALSLAPEDADILQAVEAARQQAAAEAMAATVFELDLGFDTPGAADMAAGKMTEELKGDLGQTVADSIRESFGHIAAHKLRDFISHHAIPLSRAGRFSEALERYDEAITKWRDERAWVLSTQKIWKREAGPPLITDLRRRAVEARLTIVERQREMTRRAQEAYAAIEPDQQAGDANLNSYKYPQARGNYDAALQEIARQESGVQAALAGVKETLQARLERVLRLWARQIDQDVQNNLREAERRRGLGDLDKAFQCAYAALEGSRLLNELRQRFEQITPEWQRLTWAAGDHGPQVEALYQQIEKLRRDHDLLLQAHKAIEGGDYGEAESLYKSVTADGPWSKEVAERLSKLPRLIELKTAYEQACDRRDYAAALGSLSEIIGQDGRSRWAKTDQEKLRPEVEKREKAAQYVARAREAIRKGDETRSATQYSNALAYLAAALQQSPDHPEASDLQIEAARKLEERQALAQARDDMLAAYHRGERREDYEAALEHAARVLADDPADGGAKRIQLEAQAILHFADAEIAPKMESHDWPAAQSILEEARRKYPRSPYLGALRAEVVKRLAEQTSYDDLIAQAEAAEQTQSWDVMLVKASQALCKLPSKESPRRLAQDARVQLVHRIKDRLNPAREMQETALGEAEIAAEALQNAVAELTLNDVELEELSEEERPALHLRLTEAQDSSKQVEADLDRARRIVRGRDYLKKKHIDLANRELKTLAEKRPGDREVRLLFEKVLLAEKRREAEGILDAKTQYAAAIPLLEEALALIPPEDEAQCAEVDAKLASARLEAGLKACEEALNAGKPVGEARAALRNLPAGEKRVAALIETLGAIERYLVEADHQFSHVYLPEALDAVDAALQHRKGYAPSETRRAEILDQALQRADKAAENGDYRSALKYYGLAREKGEGETYTRAAAGEKAVNNLLESLFRDKLNDASRALENNDLTEPERFRLETELNDLSKKDPERQKSTVATYLDALKERRKSILDAGTYLDNARKELDAALLSESFGMATPLFEQAKNYLDRATNVTPIAQRTRTGQMWDELNKHTRLRNETSGKTGEYATAMQVLMNPPDQRAPLAVEYATPKDVTDISDATRRRLQTAYNLNRKLLELDPQNIYLLRNWPERNNPNRDPLAIDLTFIETQQSAQQPVSEALPRALGLRMQARQHLEEAVKTRKEAVSDKEIQDAINLWEQAAQEYEGAIRQVEPLKTSADLVPSLRRLYDLCGPVMDECKSARASAESQGQSAREMLSELYTLREDADENYARSDFDPKAAQIALGLYEQILSRNPLDHDARARKLELGRKIGRQRAGAQRNGALLGFGVVLALLAILGFFTFRPGGVSNPYTPTPTVTATASSTPRPTATVTLTSTPTPTSTWTPTPTPTVTPTPWLSPTPWVCTVIRKSWGFDSVAYENSTFLGKWIWEYPVGWPVEIQEIVTDVKGKLWFKVPNASADAYSIRKNPYLYLPTEAFADACFPHAP